MKSIINISMYIGWVVGTLYFIRSMILYYLEENVFAVSVGFGGVLVGSIVCLGYQMFANLRLKEEIHLTRHLCEELMQRLREDQDGESR